MPLSVSDLNGVTTILLNRPEALNALNAETLDEIDAALDDLVANDAIRVVVFAGSGGKAFCAGADIDSMKEKTPQEAYAFARKGQRVFARIQDLPQVTIAAVNGVALGGGCELAMACDIRIAATKAKFGQPEVALGVTPGWGGTQRMPRLVGRAKAMELIVTGNLISAEDALAIGLVNKVVPVEEIWPEVHKLTETIMKKGPNAVRSAKLAISQGSEVELETGCELEATFFGLCFGPEQKEGMSAFLEKRPAQF